MFVYFSMPSLVFSSCFFVFSLCFFFFFGRSFFYFVVSSHWKSLIFGYVDVESV